MSDCPSSAQLAELVAEQVDDAARSVIEAHVETCRRCQETLERLTETTVRGRRRQEAAGSPAVIPENEQAAEGTFWEQLLSRFPLAFGAQAGSGFDGAAAPPGTERVPDRESLHTLSGYEILEELGRGGMGVVYKARQVGLNRIVALKMILDGAHAGREQLSRFQREALAVARLQHPQIVQIYEIGEWQGDESKVPLPYFSMEYMDGGSLAQKIKGIPQDSRTSAALVDALARAIHAVHQHGIIHRDLKPSNILLQKSEVRSQKSAAASSDLWLLASDLCPKITDFGLAKEIGGDQGQTVSGAILGSPNYIAPEQAEGRVHDIGPAVDMYSLGAILYELLTGHPPFRGPTVLDTLDQVRTQEPVAPSRLQPKVPRDLETICLKCLEKDAKRRYPSALSLAEDLGRFRRGEVVQARPVSALGRWIRWARRQPIKASFFGLIALIFTIGLPVMTILYVQANGLRNQADAARKQVETQRDLIQQSREQAEQHLYSARIALIQRAISAQEMNTARHLLALCAPPKDSDHPWEWLYLHRQVFAALRELKDPAFEFGAFRIAFAPNGRRLASVGGNLFAKSPDQIVPGQLIVWDTDTEQILYRLKPHSQLIHDVAYSPDGRWIATAGLDRTVKVFEASTGKDAGIFTGHGERVRWLKFSPDSRRIASVDDRELLVWDVQTRQVWKRLQGAPHLGDASPACRPVFSPDGRRLFFKPSHDSVAVVELASLKERLRLPADRANTVNWSADGRWLAASLQTNKVRIWRASDGQLHQELPMQDRGWLAFSPDGQFLALGGMRRVVQLWDVGSGQYRWSLLGHAQDICCLDWSPDSLRIASASLDGSILIFDATQDPSGTVVSTGFHSDALAALAFAEQGRVILAVERSREVVPGNLLRYDTITGEVSRCVVAPTNRVAYPRGDFTFSPDGRWLAAPGLAPAMLLIWDVFTGQVTKEFTLPDSPVRAVAWSKDCDRLAVVGAEFITLWEVKTGRMELQFPSPGGRIRQARWSPNGQWLAITQADGVILFDSATGQRARWLDFKPPARGQQPTEASQHSEDSGQDRDVLALALSPDSRFLALSGGTTPENYVQVFDLVGDEVLFTKPTHQLVFALDFSPDGRLLAANGYGRVVQLWDVSSGQDILALPKIGEGWTLTGFTPWVCFSPKGDRLMANSPDGQVSIWDSNPVQPDPRSALGKR